MWAVLSCLATHAGDHDGSQAFTIGLSMWELAKDQASNNLFDGNADTVCHLPTNVE